MENCASIIILMREETQPSAEDSRRSIPEQEDTTNSYGQPSNCAMWKVRKERTRQDLLDPRLQKYSEIFTTESLVERLSGRSRLSLVLDLDLTLLETISEDIFTGLSPTQQMEVAAHSSRWRSSYVIKRPGLDHFLSSLRPFYEFFVYSHGHPDYVREVVSILDPSGAYFADRVIAPVWNRPTIVLQKKLELVTGLADKDLAIVLDDQPEIWADMQVLQSKVFSPSQRLLDKSLFELSTFSAKFSFSDIPSEYFSADFSDTQLIDLADALKTAYFRFVGGGGSTTAAYELSEVRRSVLAGEAVSFSEYIGRIGAVQEYTREKYHLYHFAAIALGAVLSKNGRPVKEKEELPTDIAGSWLVSCLLHIRRM